MPKAKPPPAPERVAAFATGLSAEAEAVRYFTARGFAVLAQRYKTKNGEIDLIARKDDLVVFVEVKARRALDAAAWAVTPRQQARIVAAAQQWLAAHPECAALDLRFDALLIAPRRLPRHIAAAFDAST